MSKYFEKTAISTALKIRYVKGVGRYPAPELIGSAARLTHRDFPGLNEIAQEVIDATKKFRAKNPRWVQPKPKPLY